MKRIPNRSSPPSNLLRALAEFRHHLHGFLRSSEQIAEGHGLRPRQYQLLLQIAGLAPGRMATISSLAERLVLRQNSVVELADRSAAEGLLRRTEDPADRRRVVLSLTAKGRRVLGALAESHLEELDGLGPGLIRTLERIRTMRATRRRRTQGAMRRTTAAARRPESRPKRRRRR